MAWTTFRTPISGLDSPWAGQSVSGEQHTIPQSSPYELYLERIPKIKSTGTSVFDNAFVSVADMQTAGVSFTIGGVSGTITTSTSPSAGEAYFQIVTTNYGYSTKVRFNSADKGKTFSINYTGYASNLSGSYLSRVQEAAERVEEYHPCELLSTNTYSDGYFDDGDADDTSLVILSSRGDLEFSTGIYPWSTQSISLSAAGDTQVSAFTDVDGYKKIAVWLIDNSGTVEARITEGSESATKGGVGEPSAYSGEAILIGYVIVQGDGTGDAGGIEDIPQTDITSQLPVAYSTVMQRQPIFEFTWSVDGALSAGTDVAGPWFPGFAGTIQEIVMICADTGTGGSNLVVDCNKSGTSIYSGGGTQPTITANSGTYQTDVSNDMGTTAFNGTTDYFTIDIDSAPTGGDTMKVTIRGVRS